MTTFAGPAAVNVFAMTALASALRMFDKHRMTPNRHYTPTKMMAAATAYTGKKFAARDYAGAADALTEFARAQAGNLPEGNSITK